MSDLHLVALCPECMQLWVRNPSQVKLATTCRTKVASVLCARISPGGSHNSASPVALLRASFFFPTSADNRAEDLALGTVAVGLQQLDVAVDEDALALLESADQSLASRSLVMIVVCNRLIDR